jgi:hypothetical protein
MLSQVAWLIVAMSSTSRPQGAQAQLTDRACLQLVGLAKNFSSRRCGNDFISRCSKECRFIMQSAVDDPATRHCLSEANLQVQFEQTLALCAAPTRGPFLFSLVLLLLVAVALS